MQITESGRAYVTSTEFLQGAMNVIRANETIGSTEEEKQGALLLYVALALAGHPYPGPSNEEYRDFLATNYNEIIGVLLRIACRFEIDPGRVSPNAN